MQLSAPSGRTSATPAAIRPAVATSTHCSPVSYRLATRTASHRLQQHSGGILSSNAVSTRAGTALRAPLSPMRSCRPLLPHPSQPTPRLRNSRNNPKLPQPPSGAAGEAYNIADKAASPPTGRAVVVGGGPSGLAAAIGLARKAGFAVDVFDSKPDPSSDKGAKGSSLLVALGARGLKALADLGITLTVTPHTAANDSSTSGKAVYVVGADKANDPLSQAGSSSSSGAAKGLSGLMMLQGMVLLGPDGRRRVERFTGKSAAGSDGIPTGIAVIDSHSLTTALEAEATQSAAAPAPKPSAGTGPTLGLKTDSPTAKDIATAAAAAAKADAAASRVGSTAGQPAAAAAEGGGRGVITCHYENELVMVDTLNKQATFMGPSGEAHVVHYDILISAEQPGLPGSTLVSAALAQITQRDYAHHHAGDHDQHHPIYGSPAAAAASGADTTTLAAAAVASGSIAAAAAGSAAEAAAARVAAVAAAGGGALVELEYKCWHDLPHQKELDTLLPAGASSSSSRHQGPREGWLLVWSTTTANLPRSTADFPTSAESGGGAAEVIPGGPSCTLMAWPGRSGGSWSGAVFTAPQVFESLRSQSEYEGLLRGLRCVDGSAGKNTSGLPGLWVKTIAAQLKSAKAGSIPAPAVPPPKHLSNPQAGITLLAPAATLTSSPQLLCPGVALGLQDAAALTADLAAAVGSAAGGGGAVVANGSSSSAAQTAWSVERGLRAFDKERREQVAALQQLEAQLSWLRHPFSPAGTAAVSSIPPGSLAWLSGLLLKSPRSGLALQWKCMLAILPLIAALSKVLGIAAQGYSAAAAGSSDSSLGDNLAAAGVAAAGLGDILSAVKPSGGSFMAFVNTTVMSFPGVWQLLHVAPLIVGLLWTAAVVIAIKLIQWAILAYRVWGISTAAA